MATRFSIDELVTQATTDLPDNVTGLITPAAVRNLFLNLLNTIRPGYGAIGRAATPVLIENLSAVPLVLAPWLTGVIAVGGFTFNVAAGQVTHQIASAGNAGATSRITFGADVAGANNAEVLFTIFKNGVATAFQASVTTTGATNIASVNFTGLEYTAGSDAIFEVRATTTAPGSYNLSNMTLLVENVPVGSFV